ncbi:MAG: Hsp70 family protein [Polyangiaceae bacterium]
MTFRIDANGILAVEAKDLGTNRSHSVEVKPASGLTQAEVDTLVADGDRFKEADQLRRELAEWRNQAEALIYTTEQALEGYADLLQPEKVVSMRADVQALRALLDKNAEIDAIRTAYAALEQATFEIAEAMYGGDATT